MSARAIKFAKSWIAENIDAEPFEPTSQTIAAHVEQLKADAQADGIDEDELAEDIGDLSDYVAEAMEAASDDETDVLADRDD